MTLDRESAASGQTALDHDRFTGLWDRLSSDDTPEHGEQVFRKLAQLYAADNRYYHSDEHINLCLSKLDEAGESSGRSDAVEMAVWFHDAIYDAGDPENERNSARMFRRCADRHMAEDAISEVENLIVATTHRETPANWQEELLVDVDLSSFGLPWEKFVEDGRNIRREFGDLSDEDFVLSQGRFLKQLLNRQSIYHTRYFRGRYEQTARDNIRQILLDYERGMAP